MVRGSTIVYGMRLHQYLQVASTGIGFYGGKVAVHSLSVVGTSHAVRRHSHSCSRRYDSTTPQDDISFPTKSVSTKTRWITCASTNELLSAIRSNTIVRSDSVVAELGSQLRDVSCAVAETSARSILVDVKRKFPKKATSERQATRTRAMRLPGDDAALGPSATFYEMDALEDWRRVFLATKCNFDVLVLDVNAIVGNDLEWTSLSIVREFSALFPTCHTILIKSESLNTWATRLVHGQRWIDGTAAGPTNRSSSLSIKSPKVVATIGVTQYRQTIPRTVQSGDAVLEVGCHMGTTTTLLHQAAAGAAAVSEVDGDGTTLMTTTTGMGYAIGVDVGPKIVRGARKKNEDVYFAVGDAWKTAELLRIQRDFQMSESFRRSSDRTLGFDIVYVDVGGLSGKDGLLEALTLLSALMNALEPRCVVIKSACVRRLSSILIPYWKIELNQDSNVKHEH